MTLPASALTSENLASKSAGDQRTLPEHAEPMFSRSAAGGGSGRTGATPPRRMIAHPNSSRRAAWSLLSKANKASDARRVTHVLDVIVYLSLNEDTCSPGGL